MLYYGIKHVPLSHSYIGGIYIMEEDIYLHKLNLRNVKPTAIRLLILRTMMARIDAYWASHAAEKEALLKKRAAALEKLNGMSTLAGKQRTELWDLIHAIDDGSGALKYAVCSDDCTCSVSDQHVHFYCEGCHRAFCFRSQAVPVVQAPEGFVLYGVNYVLKGLCPACAARPDKD